MKTEYSTPWQLVARRDQQTSCKLVEFASHAQGVRRRLPPADLFADGFLQIDDRARLIHRIKLARRRSGGECLFEMAGGTRIAHATSAFSLRQTSSTFARELKAEILK
jgi:hypothetical protein